MYAVAFIIFLLLALERACKNKKSKSDKDNKQTKVEDKKAKSSFMAEAELAEAKFTTPENVKISAPLP